MWVQEGPVGRVTNRDSQFEFAPHTMRLAKQHGAGDLKETVSLGWRFWAPRCSARCSVHRHAAETSSNSGRSTSTVEIYTRITNVGPSSSHVEVSPWLYSCRVLHFITENKELKLVSSFVGEFASTILIQLTKQMFAVQHKLFWVLLSVAGGWLRN